MENEALKKNNGTMHTASARPAAPEEMFDKSLLLPKDAVSASPLSVYIGRVVYMPDNWLETGMVYVDINSIRKDSPIIAPATEKDSYGWEEKTDKELERLGYRRATLSHTLRCAANLWAEPQPTYYKGSFGGNGSITISNYMFDPLTMTWITTVSTALNAIGIVNVPPVIVSLSEYGVPYPQGNTDAGAIVEETFSDIIDGITDMINPSKADSLLPRLNASDITGKIKASLLEGISKGTGLSKTVAETLSVQNESMRACIPRLKNTYEYDALKYRMDTLHEELAENETVILRKLDALQKSADSASSALASSATSAFYGFVDTAVMGIVSPIVSRIVSMYNEAIDAVRAKISDVVTSVLTEPLRKIKTKVSRIVSQAINPVMSKLPSPVRTVAAKLIKQTLSAILEQVFGFIIDAITEPIKRIFDKGKDAIVELISSAFSSLSDTVMSAFSDDLIKRAGSKMEWLMTTDAGTAIYALTETVPEHAGNMDKLYAALHDMTKSSGAKRNRYTALLAETLFTFTQAVHGYVSMGDLDALMPDIGKLLPDGEYYDPVRGCQIGLPIIPERFKSVSSALMTTDAETCDLLVRLLQPKFDALSIYAQALFDVASGNVISPSEAVAKAVEKIQNAVAVPSADKERLISDISAYVSDAVEKSLKCTRGIDKDVLATILELLGIKSDELEYGTSSSMLSEKTSPRISTSCSIFPETTFIPPDGYSITDADGNVHVIFSGSHWRGAVWQMAMFISELLESVYALVTGCVAFTNGDDGVPVPVSAHDMDGHALLRYSVNGSDKQALRQRKETSVVWLDKDTGMYLEAAPAFLVSEYAYRRRKNPTEYADVNLYNMDIDLFGPKKSTDRSYPSTMITADMLVHEALYSDVEAMRIYHDTGRSLIPVGKKQAELLGYWGVFFITKPDYVTFKDGWSPDRIPLYVETDDETKSVRLYAIVLDSSGNLAKRYLTDYEKGFVASRNPVAMHRNGTFTAENVTYYFPYIDKGDRKSSDDTATVHLRRVYPSNLYDKNGVPQCMWFSEDVLTPRTDEDGNPVTDENGSPVMDTSEEIFTCPVWQCVPVASRIMYYREGSDDDPVDVSAFFYLSPARMSDSDRKYCPRAVFVSEDAVTGSMDGASVRGIIPTNGSASDMPKGYNGLVTRYACREIVAPFDTRAEADPFMSGSTPKNWFEERRLYRDPVTEIWNDDVMELYRNVADAAGDETAPEHISADDAWEYIQSKVHDAIEVAKSSACNTIADALHGIDWDSITENEPVLSDMQQKTMDRLVEFVENGDIDTDDFASEYTDTMKQMMSRMGSIASDTVDISSLENKVKSLLGATEAVSEVLGAVSSMGDISNTIQDNFDAVSGSLDTSIVESISSVAGPSMSCACSIGEYDMSLTEKPKSQMPWKFGTDTEQFINVGDVVLMLAIGNSTDRLWIVEKTGT